MNTLKFFVIFALCAFQVFAVEQEGPYCYQVGTKLYGKNLDGLCVHHTGNYGVAFEVVDGMVEIDLPDGVFPRLEIYSGERVFNDSEDCCPPDTFIHEIECELSCPYDHPLTTVEGHCCYDKETIHVTGLPSTVGCLHSIEDFATYLPVNSSVSWSYVDVEKNGEVEVYANLMPDGCCGCFMYSIPCGKCEQSTWEDIMEFFGLD